MHYIFDNELMHYIISGNGIESKYTTISSSGINNRFLFSTVTL